ncbi:MAG: sulfate adenylyltransferase subunit CysD [Nitrosomonadales bacterium]|nr:MAG: sulfate adenylyltransferase subunit CysD [Nitrosomonadales bacterium]
MRAAHEIAARAVPQNGPAHHAPAGKAHFQPGHLKVLESEAIHIMREVAAEFSNPVMLYSIGKDSSVMLHLARKAFYPGPLPFPLLHVDTGFKFHEMIEFRDWYAKEIGARLIVHRNEAAIAQGIHPNKAGVARCCGQLKTAALLQALDKYGFDAALGGARRDEEKSRAKERIFSFRDEFGQWDPKNQRPELWDIYNCRIHEGQSIRVFPLSNWTEMDIWQYIRTESIPIVPLYFARKRMMVRRGPLLIPAGDAGNLREGEVPEPVMSRFRTLGCSPCTGAIESGATTLDEIVAEAAATTRSERETRIIDHGANSMEDKKREGYF